jgi:site-specific DNA recombinase
MKLALYVRVVCREPGGIRLAMQIGALRKWAAARGHAVTREFVDVGCSGLRLDRPGLDALRSAAASRDFDALLVSTRDPLTRVAADGVRLVDELSARGVRVLLVD